MAETVAAIVAAHRAGAVTPAQTVARSFQRIRDYNDPAVFISLRDEKDALAEAEALEAKDPALLPLYGIPVAVKDNIDALGMPTPAARRSPIRRAGATAVARPRAAGAIIIGKIISISSPPAWSALAYGIPNNPMRRDLIRADRVRDRRWPYRPDWCRWRSAPIPRATAGCRRCSSNIVGLKPSLGLISTAGWCRPAGRWLHFGVFAPSMTMTALAAMAGPDGADPFSRNRPLGAMTAFPSSLRLGVPRQGQLIFFGDKAAEKAYGGAIARWTALGASLVEFDLEPLYETARLLYEGPWVAERYLVIRDLLASSPDSIHPVTREITAAGARLTAADTFAALYRLQALRKISRARLCQYRCAGTADGADRLFHRAGAGQSVDSTPARYLHQFCQSARPLRAGVAGGDTARRYSFGITLLAPAGHDAQLRLDRPRLPCRYRTCDGRAGLPQPPLATLPTRLEPATKSPSRWSVRICRAWC